MTLGMQLRNKLGLWDHESELVKWFIDIYGISHADDISGMIIDTMQRVLNGKRHDMESMAEHFKQYWAKQGINPYPQNVDWSLED